MRVPNITCLLWHSLAKSLKGNVYMKIDDIFVLFENSDKYFKTYADAYFNSKKPGMSKQVWYVFTPTMARYKRVCEIERACQKYFRKHTDCDFYNLVNKTGYKQLNLI